MSVEAIAEVMRMKITDGVGKLVAMVLADYADPVTGRCWPKIPTLAQQCSQSERTVQRKLRLLEELDVLHMEPNTTGDRKGNVYVLHLRGVPRPEKPPPGDGRAPTGDRNVPNGGAAQTGDSVSPHVTAGKGPESHPTGDTPDTRRVTLLSPPKESTRESTRESITEPDGSAPRGGAAGQTFSTDFRKELNVRGVRAVQALLNRPELRCRTLIGAWLKLAADDAATVLRTIDDAAEAQPVEPVGWIEARLRRRRAESPPAAGTAVAPEVASERQAEALRMAARGEWPIGGTVFIDADSPDGLAWEAHYRAFQAKPKWRQCPEGWGGYLPARMPPAPAARA